VSEVRKSDQVDGSFINPILHADYSDPDVNRVGDDY
jgi:beta-xylosidase